MFKQRVYFVEKHLPVVGIGDDGVYHLVVAVYHLLKLLFPFVLALLRKTRCGDEHVGDAAQRAYDNDNGLLARFFLYDTFQTQNAFHGTYRCSAEF